MVGVQNQGTRARCHVTTVPLTSLGPRSQPWPRVPPLLSKGGTLHFFGKQRLTMRHRPCFGGARCSFESSPKALSPRLPVLPPASLQGDSGFQYWLDSFLALTTVITLVHPSSLAPEFPGESPPNLGRSESHPQAPPGPPPPGHTHRAVCGGHALQCPPRGAGALGQIRPCCP